MRASPSLIGLAVLTAVLPGCSSKSIGSASASASAANGATRAPGVVVDKEGTWLDGKRVADAPAEGAKKVDGLFNAARDKRTAAGITGPSTEPMAVSLPSDISCGAGMSVLKTLLFVGYPKERIDFGGKSHDVSMAIPLPDAKDSKPNPDAHVSLTSSGAELRLDVCLAAYDQVPVAKAAEVMKNMTGGKLNRLFLTCGEGVSFSDAMALYDATQPAGGLSGDGGCFPPTDAPKPIEPIPLPDKWKGSLRVGAVSFAGPLDIAAIQATEAKGHDKLAGCYAAAAANNKNLQGRLTATFVIGKKGSIISFPSIEVIPDVPGLPACFKNVIAQWTFPASEGITSTTIPIVFAPGG